MPRDPRSAPTTTTAEQRRRRAGAEYNAELRLRPGHEVLAILGERWATLVLDALSTGPLRYSELRRAVAGATRKMLTQTGPSTTGDRPGRAFPRRRRGARVDPVPALRDRHHRRPGRAGAAPRSPHTTHSRSRQPFGAGRPVPANGLGGPRCSLASRFHEELGDAVIYPTKSSTDADWSSGDAGAGTIRVRIDAAATDARVELRRGWRSAVGPDVLGPAVLEAFRAASQARLQSWAADLVASDVLRTAVAPTPRSTRSAPPAPPDREAVAELRRAFRDLREFSLQLAALVRTPRTVSGAGREVEVVALGGQVVDLRLDPAWRRTALDSDLEQRITATLRSALQQCAALPAQALQGCPDLVAVLARSPGGAPFPLPATPTDPSHPAPRGGR